MAEYLKFGKEECLKRLESVIEHGKNLKSSIAKEYRIYVDKDQWQELPDGLLEDWGRRFIDWEGQVKEQLQSVFLAGASKITKFEEYRTAMMSTGPKMNDKFRIITDKLRDKLDVLLKMLESIESGGTHHSINVQDSHGVVVNTGVIEGKIEINANRIKGDGNPQLADAISELVKAIKQDESGDLEQEAMLQQAGILAQQATLPPEQRKSAVVKAAWSYIEAFSKVATIGNFLMSHGKTIATFFGF